MTRESRFGTVRRRGILLAALLMLGTPGTQAEEPKQEPSLFGYCPAAYLLHGKAMRGDPLFQSTFQGNRYYLSSADAKKAFDADPEKYTPRLDGMDAVALGGPYGNRFDGNPRLFEIHDGKVYLFALDRSRQAFRSNGPDTYAAKAEERFREPQIFGHCPVSYQIAGKAVKGDEKFRVIYRGNVFHLASAEARALFLKNPHKYLPQYRGLCAEGVTREKEFPTQATTFAVIDGKTYFFWDAAAREKFLENAEANIKTADTVWAKIGAERRKIPITEENRTPAVEGPPKPTP